MPGQPALRLVQDEPGRKVYEVPRAFAGLAATGAALSVAAMAGGAVWIARAPGPMLDRLADPILLAAFACLLLVLYGCLNPLLLRVRFHLLSEDGELFVEKSFPLLYRSEPTRVTRAEAEALDLFVWALGDETTYEIGILKRGGGSISLYEGETPGSAAAFAAEASRCLGVPIHERREGRRNTVHPPGTVVRLEG